MRKLLAALTVAVALLWQSPAIPQIIGPTVQVICSRSAIATVATATTTSLVNGVAGQSVYICGWHVTSTQSASTTFQFVQGTQGGPCGTPVAITPAFNVTSTAPSADHVDYASIQQVPPGQQVCVATTGATVGQSIILYYSQF
jgi:hypothetical protein